MNCILYCKGLIVFLLMKYCYLMMEVKKINVGKIYVSDIIVIIFFFVC